ncbi:hypothetical protein GIB67_021074 [Kingdonia uniflora]|uniref:Adenosine deaminase domain-containing protein n=1 Tax=Kingdonia uniflora TaxID=39325 RepID=A0A7J7N705_9MAGN|nr:hypothetical protein GIB67_021074 [Kingdonia uniflora]
MNPDHSIRDFLILRAKIWDPRHQPNRDFFNSPWSSSLASLATKYPLPKGNIVHIPVSFHDLGTFSITWSKIGSTSSRGWFSSNIKVRLDLFFTVSASNLIFGSKSNDLGLIPLSCDSCTLSSVIGCFSGLIEDDRSLVECFKMIDLIHILTTDHATITRITKEVVEDFAYDNIVYVELRTTPKKNDAIGMSKRSYMEAVIDGLRAVDMVDVDFIPSVMGPEIFKRTFRENNGITRKKICVRLLLSIDRRETTAAAMETVSQGLAVRYKNEDLTYLVVSDISGGDEIGWGEVRLALEMKNLGVVGIDLSGNPAVGEWSTFLPALEFAKEQGLPVTLHCGELPNRKEEVQAMLAFSPQRIGHAICFEKEEWRKLKSSKILVEICLTSNIRTECVASINDHHFIDLYNSKHPLALCTDDSGVFSTSLSREFSLASTAFGLGKEELLKLGRSAIEYIFADEVLKKHLKEIFDSSARDLFG